MNDNFAPHLAPQVHGPVPQLEQYLLEHQTKIELWFREQFQTVTPPFYASVDLRNSEFKIAPVDTNLFPAGFNNLNKVFLPLAIQACQATIESQMPNCTRVLLIPENHTRNPFYFDNISMLQDIIMKAGFEVRLGSLIEALKEPKSLVLDNGKEIILEPLIRKNDRLMVKNFDPCLIILNNDLSDNIPEILQDLAQPVLPGINMGWSTRTKTKHFKHYREVAKKFAEFIDIDPWFFTPLFSECSAVDFMARKGEECLREKTKQLLSDIAAKYKQYEIEKPPFVAVKADSGTYGIGVMMVDDADKFVRLGRNARKEMAVTKGGRKLERVIIQEGVYTCETLGDQNFTAEPIVYMIGRYVVGGFYRIHPDRGDNQNLNSPGMQAIPLAFSQTCNNPNNQLPGREPHNRFYAYGVIARLALLAAAHEAIPSAGVKDG